MLSFLLLPLFGFFCGVESFSPFEHKMGSCTLEGTGGGMCILSANYPNDYKANDFCRFHVKANGYLKVMSWDVESDDWMKVCSPVGIFGTECKTTSSSEIARDVLY